MQDVTSGGKQYFVITVPLGDSTERFTVCECTTVDNAVEVVKSLISANKSKPYNVMVEIRYAL